MEQTANQATIDYEVLKRGGIMRQRSPGFFSVRLHSVAGQFTAGQLTSIATLAERYGRGEVHLTARQGVEIPHVRFEALKDLKADLDLAGLGLGACGPRVRLVTGCQGSDVCTQGLFDTLGLSRRIDKRYFGQELPCKFKFAVSGCTNNCLKVQENDFGIIGALEPDWAAGDCTFCGACEYVCGARALEVGDDEVTIDRGDCTRCGDCVASCPTDAWKMGRRGFRVFVGGKMGRNPVFGRLVPRLIETEAELFERMDGTLDFFRKHGQTGERFAATLDRIGFDRYLQEVFDESPGTHAGHSGRGVSHDLDQDADAARAIGAG